LRQCAWGSLHLKTRRTAAQSATHKGCADLSTSAAASFCCRLRSPSASATASHLRARLRGHCARHLPRPAGQQPLCATSRCDLAARTHNTLADCTDHSLSRGLRLRNTKVSQCAPNLLAQRRDLSSEQIVLHSSNWIVSNADKPSRALSHSAAGQSKLPFEVSRLTWLRNNLDRNALPARLYRRSSRSNCI
jgi:hypothetical protein